MKRSALLLSMLLTAGPAAAQVAAPETENGRYTMSPVEGGVMRLDTRTGQVSICRKRDEAWACEAAADDRAAYEKEIARLQEKVARLESGRGGDLKLPSDEDVDRAMTFFQKILRRFKSMIEDLQREDSARRT